MSTIVNEIGTVFLPVRNIEESRNWYCGLLGVQPQGDIQFGHLFNFNDLNGNEIIVCQC